MFVFKDLRRWNVEKIVGKFILIMQRGRIIVLNESRYPVTEFLTESDAIQWAEQESAKDDTPSWL